MTKDNKNLMMLRLDEAQEILVRAMKQESETNTEFLRRAINALARENGFEVKS